MFTAQQADIFVVVPNPNYKAEGTHVTSSKRSGKVSKNAAILIPLGFAQSIRIDDNFNAQSVNVLGQPLPIIHPGYQMTTINIEKATIDGYSFRNLGGFNPLWAHVGASYLDENLINLGAAGAAIGLTDVTAMYPFMFILAVKDRVSDSFQYGNSGQLGTDNMRAKGEEYAGNFATPTEYSSDAQLPYAIDGTKDKPTPNLVGTYVCVVNTVSTALQSNNAIIMDNISAYARPLNGTWMNNAMKEALRSEGRAGMSHDLYDPLFGYDSRPTSTAVLGINPNQPQNA